MQSLSNLAILCSWADWFVSYVVRNPEERFARVEAQIIGGTLRVKPGAKFANVICFQMFSSAFNSYRQLLSSADILCKQSGPRSGSTECPSSSGSKPLGTLVVFLKDFAKSRQMTTKPWKISSMQILRNRLFARSDLLLNVSLALGQSLELIPAAQVI